MHHHQTDFIPLNIAVLTVSEGSRVVESGGE